MSQTTAGLSRQTRSTYNVPSSVLQNLALDQSPLKQARTAARRGWKPRSNQPTASNSSRAASEDTVDTTTSHDHGPIRPTESTEAPWAGSSTYRPQPTNTFQGHSDLFSDKKRPTPPPTDGHTSPSHKRIRRDISIDFSSLGRKAFPDHLPLHSPHKLLKPLPSTPSRSRSVPAHENDNVPHLDLYNVKNSPYRSPVRTPGRSKSRIASLPPPSPTALGLDLSDHDTGDELPTMVVDPPTPRAQPYDPKELLTPRPPLPHFPNSDMSVISAISAATSVPETEREPSNDSTTPPANSSPFSSPLSELTSLPSTPVQDDTPLPHITDERPALRRSRRSRGANDPLPSVPTTPRARSSSPIAVPLGAFDFNAIPVAAKPESEVMEVDTPPGAQAPIQSNSVPKTPRARSAVSNERTNSTPGPSSANGGQVTTTPTIQAQTLAASSAAKVESLFDSLIGPSAPSSQPTRPVMNRSKTPTATAAPVVPSASASRPSMVTTAPKTPGQVPPKTSTTFLAKTPATAQAKTPVANMRSKTPTPAPSTRPPTSNARPQLVHRAKTPVTKPTASSVQDTSSVGRPAQETPSHPQRLGQASDLQLAPHAGPSGLSSGVGKGGPSGTTKEAKQMVQSKLSFGRPSTGPPMGSRRITRSTSMKVPETGQNIVARPVNGKRATAGVKAGFAIPGPAMKNKGKAPMKVANEDSTMTDGTGAVNPGTMEGEGVEFADSNTPTDAKVTNIDLTGGNDVSLKPPPRTPGKPPSTGVGRPPSGQFTFAMPTSSSQAKSRPSSPSRPLPRTPGKASDDSLLPRRSMGPTGIPGSATRRRSVSVAPRPVFSATNKPMSTAGTSLSNLSHALEKLSAPTPQRPTRPSTSMGFEPANGMDTDTEDETAGAGKSMSSVKRTSSNTSVMSSASQPMAKRRQSVGASVTNARPSTSSSPATIPRPDMSRFSMGTSNKNATSTGSKLGNGVASSSRGLGGSAVGVPSKKPFGAGPGWSSGASKSMGSRLGARASRPTTLATVEASPVKGANAQDATPTDDTAPFGQSSVPAPIFGGLDDDVIMDDSGSGQRAPVALNDAKGKQVDRISVWRGRVSLVSDALNQAVADIPVTPPAPVAPLAPVHVPTHNRSTRAKTAMGPPSAPWQASGSQSQAGSPVGSVATTNGRHVSRRGAPPQGEHGRLEVLKDCTIFVDVRTDDGDDAGSFFTEMLKNMGARLVQRVGPSCTHVVFKNGLMSTITKWRLLNEPRPEVVGIGWVVESVEKRTKVDEVKFRVDLELMNVAGTNKRRRSMLPKAIGDLGLDSVNMSPNGGDTSDVSMDNDTPSARSINTDDGMTPLERARKRKSLLPVR